MSKPPEQPGKGGSSSGGSSGGNQGAPTPVPEPGMIGLFALGIAGTAIARRRMRRRN